MASKPSSSPGTSGAPAGADWATQGFTEITPTDKAANLGDSDLMLNTGREATLPDCADYRKERIRGKIKVLKSK